MSHITIVLNEDEEDNMGQKSKSSWLESALSKNRIPNGTQKDFAPTTWLKPRDQNILKEKDYTAPESQNRDRELPIADVKIIVYTAKPGVVIGKGGSEIEKVKAELAQFTDKKLIVDIKEIKRPDKDAQQLRTCPTRTVFHSDVYEILHVQNNESRSSWS